MATKTVKPKPTTKPRKPTRAKPPQPPQDVAHITFTRGPNESFHFDYGFNLGSISLEQWGFALAGLALQVAQATADKTKPHIYSRDLLKEILESFLDVLKDELLDVADGADATKQAPKDTGVSEAFIRRARRESGSPPFSEAVVRTRAPRELSNGQKDAVVALGHVDATLAGEIDKLWSTGRSYRWFGDVSDAQMCRIMNGLNAAGMDLLNQIEDADKEIKGDPPNGKRQSGSAAVN